MNSEKTLGAMKAERIVKGITFTPSEANPGETLYVHVPKLNANEVIVPGSLALLFNIDLTGGHANIFLVQNVLRALVDKFTVIFEGSTLQDTPAYDNYKIFENLFLLYCTCAKTTCRWEGFKPKNFQSFARMPATK